MKDSHSQQLSSELQSAFAVIGRQQNYEKQSVHLLEFRTEHGSIYVRPSPWQRIRLQRAFRYFRVVPPQLLRQSDQRLIARLLQTAVVAPHLPLAEGSVFGVVEQVHSKPSAAPAVVATVITEPLKTTLPPPARESETVARPPAFIVTEARLLPRLRPWIVSGATAAAGIPLIMASVYGISMFPTNRQISTPPAIATPVQQAALHSPASELVSISLPIGLPKPPTVKRRANAGFPLAVKRESPAAVMTASPDRRFVSELPPGYFAHPVVNQHLDQHNLVGEVRLRAVIGADGSVKQVTVLSGNPRLAQAGRRAVMQWHYSPYEGLGGPIGVETEIRMTFFGPDAVSIASVAGGPAS